MFGSDAEGLVKALGFIAWADDRIAPEEREMLATVMNALGIPEDRRKELCESLKDGPASLRDIKASFSDDMERRFAVAQAIVMARADGEFADVERREIAKLAGALGVDRDELEMIYAAVDVTGDMLTMPPPSAV
jgi:tellurite resistance protein